MERSPLSVLVLAFLIAAGIGPAGAREPFASKQPVKNPVRSVQPLTTGEQVYAYGGRALDRKGAFGIREVGPDPGPEMSFELDWTSCQWHRVNTNDPLQTTLQMSITTNTELVWCLFDTNNGGNEFTLPLQQNVFGYPEVDTYIPLQWDYRIDGESWVVIVPNGESGIQITIPAGIHVVELKITGNTPCSLNDGYYRLTMTQQLTPQL